jgi:hypothetical protein
MKLMFKEGDLLWMNRLPGGVCVFIERNQHKVTLQQQMYTVIHPTEGLIIDCDYYFTPLEGEE